MPEGSILPGEPASVLGRQREERAHRDNVDQAVALELAQRLAIRLGVDARLIKPCIASIGPQQEGLRHETCFVLAVALLQTGAQRDLILQYLGSWAERCDQPPKTTHPFTFKEVAVTLRSAECLRRSGSLRGHGCRSLSLFCPYGGYEHHTECSFVRSLYRAKPQTATLVGALNVASGHPAPDLWRSPQQIRRRWLMAVLAKLEVLRGRSGGLLITSSRELAYHSRCPRSTVQRDLRAMRDAGWIDYTPGLPRLQTAGQPPRGSSIRRLPVPGVTP